MALNLILLRHAKAARAEPEIPDHERPLTKWGRRQARAVGQYLRANTLQPDLIVSSTARRARATARRVANQLKPKPLRLLYPELYKADAQQAIEVLKTVPMAPATLLVVGHNPCWDQLASHVLQQTIQLPTAGLVRIELPIDRWFDWSWHVRGTLVGEWSPPQEDE